MRTEKKEVRWIVRKEDRRLNPCEYFAFGEKDARAFFQWAKLKHESANVQLIEQTITTITEERVVE
jgi:hypothetical protein